MAPLPRLLVAACAALLAAGAAGAATVHPAHRGHGLAAGATTSTIGGTTDGGRSTTDASRGTTGSTGGTAPTSTSRPGPPPPTSAALKADLVSPTDMGGYYRVVPDQATAFLDSAPCLAVLQPSPSQGGRAVTALLGPDSHSVPAILEEVASYPDGESRSVYQSVVQAFGACSSLSFTFAGTAVTSPLARTAIPPVGDSEQVWSGSFSAAGAAFSLQIGMVLDGPDVLSVIWLDSVPPSDPVMGSFTSTLSLAIGKLA